MLTKEKPILHENQWPRSIMTLILYLDISHNISANVTFIRIVIFPCLITIINLLKICRFYQYLDYQPITIFCAVANLIIHFNINTQIDHVLSEVLILCGMCFNRRYSQSITLRANIRKLIWLRIQWHRKKKMRKLVEERKLRKLVDLIDKTRATYGENWLSSHH